MIRTNFHAWAAGLCAIVLAVMLPASAWAQSADLGDLNQDGEMNVLDVQGTVAEALGARVASGRADLDENGQVNILDIQNMVNSALGTGGLVQIINGRVDVQCTENTDYFVMAVAGNGRAVRTPVDCETGRFRLRLRVRASWTIALCERTQLEEQVQVRVVAVFRFRVGGADSDTLPIPRLSAGIPMELGLLIRDQDRLRTRLDLGELLGQLQPPIDPADANENGVPDVVEPLLFRLRDGHQGLPPSVDLTALYAIIGDCVTAWLEAGVTPSVVDENANGRPDFLEPLEACLTTAIQEWLIAIGVTIPQGDPDGDGVPEFVEGLVRHVLAGVPMWLREMNHNDAVDEDGDGVPDDVSEMIGRPGEPHRGDSDGDGIPNFAEDNDGDGIPNYLDPDCQMEGDRDCDGIPNAEDEDADGDGVPNYADAAPLDPEVQ